MRPAASHAAMCSSPFGIDRPFIRAWETRCRAARYATGRIRHLAPWREADRLACRSTGAGDVGGRGVLDGKVALITGGGRGGRPAAARRVAAEGGSARLAPPEGGG